MAQVKFVKVYMAQSLPGLKPPPLVLVASKVIPHDYDGNPKRFERDAKKILNALEASLPGGTLNRIACMLLSDYGNHLVVPVGRKRRR